VKIESNGFKSQDNIKGAKMKNQAEEIGKEAADRVDELERVLEFRADVIAVQAEEIEALERELAEEKAKDKFYHNIFGELKIMAEEAWR
jgi:polyhydroxyalkanoate synthesis regulator phasin